MAIWAYVGLPRNGKSYNVVAEQIIPALKAGRRVVTNIPLLPEGLEAKGCDVSGIVQLENDALMPENAAKTIKEHCTPGSLVVVDELWRFIPTGGKMDPVWGSLFAEHGHRVDAQGRMMQIVLVVQDLSMIAASARALVERTVVVTKLTVVGSGSRYRADVYQGKVTGLKPPIKQRIAEEFGSYDVAVFKCYVSRTMAEGGAEKVDESVLSGRGTLLRNPVVRYGLPIALVLIVGGLWKAWAFFHPPMPQPKAVKPELVEVAKTSQRLLVAAPVGKFRVSAVMRAGSDVDSRVLLDACDGAPSRWVRWFSARCVDDLEGGVLCEWHGQRYELRAAVKECREQVDESRSGEIRWFPPDDPRPRESLSLVGSSVDRASR